MVFVTSLDHPVLDDSDAHHLGRVLRLRAGEMVVASDGAGGWRPCRWAPPARLEPDLGAVAVTAAGAVAVTAAGGGAGAGAGVGEVVRPGGVRVAPAPSPVLAVGFVPTKADRPEWTVQKLTELGVDRIVVLSSARSVVRWDASRGERHMARLRDVARSAAMQSRRPRLPSVEGILTFEECATAPAGWSMADPGGAPPDLRQPAVLIGPEGGWSPAEEAADLPRVALGPNVLRAETAAVTAGALLAALRAGLVGAPDHLRPGPG